MLATYSLLSGWDLGAKIDGRALTTSDSATANGLRSQPALQNSHTSLSSMMHLRAEEVAALTKARSNTRIHVPAWAMAPLRPRASNATEYEMIVAMAASHSQSDEDTWAMQQYFWGQTGGTVLESGALHGDVLANSYALEEKLGWRSINIEASPASFDKLVVNRPNALNLNVALCARSSVLHFVMGDNDAIYGIWEFMAVEFRKAFFSGVADSNVDNAEPIAGVRSMPIACGPLGAYLSLLGIEHIDFWSLDVEGAELEALRGVDLDRVTVDVIAIEFENDAVKDHAVREYLTSRGYEIHVPKDPEMFPLYSDRNGWFIRKAARPSLRSQPGHSAWQ